jgi:DNA-binding transcriptional ArsR family regulator
MNATYKNFDHKLVDKIYSNRLRLAIMSALLHSDEVDFTSLKQAVRATDGNLSIQIGLLREAGLILVNRTRVGNRDQTYLALSDKGRMSLLNLKRLLGSWLG